MAALWIGGAHAIYSQVLTLWGFPPFRYPFLDIDSSLAAWDCARKGMDVIPANPCDVLHLGFHYPPVWLSLDWIPLGRSDRIWVGLAMAVAFLASLSSFPPALSQAENALRIAAVLSTTVAFAIERANVDILVFLLVSVMLPLLLGSPISRALGYSVAFLAGALKYYPFVLFVLLSRERARIAIAIGITFIVALLLFLGAYASQIREGLPYIPHFLPFGGIFGADNLLPGLVRMLHHATGSVAEAIWGALAISGLVFGAILWLTVRLWRNADMLAALDRLDEARRLALLAGALLTAGCFFGAQNISYRGIFLLFMLPGLFALGCDGRAGALSRAARLAAFGIPLLLWVEAFRLWIHLAATGHYPPPEFESVQVLDQPGDVAAWLAREVVWWLLVGFSLSILFGVLVAKPLDSARRMLWSLRTRI